MAWIAVATIGGSIIGGMIQSDAIGSAADQQSAAARDANALQKYMYDQTRTDNAPWRTAGETALNKLNSLLSDPSMTSPYAGQIDNEAGYQFAKQEGMRAIDNSASARGGIGGAALKAGARFAEDNANKFYGDAFNRFQTDRQNRLDPLYRMAGYGSSANTANQLAGSQYANAAGNNMLGAANANAAAGMERGNIWGNVINQGIAVGNRNNWWQNPQQPGFGPYLDPFFGGTGGSGD
jgi:hypothetical protein